MKEYFSTLDEQVKLLKSRNLIIDDEARVKDKLLNYNYYKVINGTKKYFVKSPKSNTYKDGVEFRELEKLHEFDKFVKRFLLNSILDIERHLRSIISYVFMENHPEKNAYLNPDNFNDNQSLVAANSHSLTKTIENYREEKNYNKSIQYYTNKYNYVPFWFLINFISFGKLVNFYQTMKKDEAYEVANIFRKFLNDNVEGTQAYYITIQQFDSYIKAIKDIRNVVAHDNLILGYEAEDDLLMIDPIFDDYKIGKKDKRDKVFHIYLVMKLFLTRSQFRELTFSLQKSIEILKKEIREDAFNMVMKDLGFPKNF